MNSISKFKKIPIEVEAIQFDGENIQDCLEFCNQAYVSVSPKEGRYLLIPTIEGNMACYTSSWIIRGVAGEFYPCKDEIFKKTYERVG